MSAAPGQLDLSGHEQPPLEDPRLERVARALFLADLKRINGPDGQEALENRAKALWPSQRLYHVAQAKVALDAAGER